MSKSKKIKNPRIISELKRIAAENNGLLLADDVVERARPAGSPLHSHFLWDNTEAAHQFRLLQARNLINIAVEVIHADGEEREMQVFVSLKDDRANDGGGYRTTVDVMGNAGLRKQLLQQALEDLEYFAEKYKNLKELAEVFKVIKRVVFRKKK